MNAVSSDTVGFCIAHVCLAEGLEAQDTPLDEPVKSAGGLMPIAELRQLAANRGLQTKVARVRWQSLRKKLRSKNLVLVLKNRNSIWVCGRGRTAEEIVVSDPLYQNGAPFFLPRNTLEQAWDGEALIFTGRRERLTILFESFMLLIAAGVIGGAVLLFLNPGNVFGTETAGRLSGLPPAVAASDRARSDGMSLPPADVAASPPVVVEKSSAEAGQKEPADARRNIDFRSSGAQSCAPEHMNSSQSDCAAALELVGRNVVADPPARVECRFAIAPGETECPSSETHSSSTVSGERASPGVEDRSGDNNLAQTSIVTSPSVAASPEAGDATIGINSAGKDSGHRSPDAGSTPGTLSAKSDTTQVGSTSTSPAAGGSANSAPVDVRPPSQPASSVAPNDHALAEPVADHGFAARAAFLKRGDSLLLIGDIIAARSAYEQVADIDGQAALRLGETYDPAFLARLGATGAFGDMAAAKHWYQRALELGTVGAQALISNTAPKKNR